MNKNLLLKKLLTNEKGFSLVIALMTLVVLSVIGISMFSISNNTSKAAEWERDDQAVYYIAEAGLVEAKIEFQKIVDEIWDNNKTHDDNLTDIEYPILSALDQKPYTFEKHFSNDTTATITITPNAKDQYSIYSEGTIDGNSNARAVTQTIFVKTGGIIDDGSDTIVEIDPDTIPGTTPPTPPIPPTPTTPPEDDDEGKRLEEIVKLLSCPKKEYTLPIKYKDINEPGNVTIREGIQTNGSVNINGDLTITGNKNGFLVVNGDLTVNGNINFGNNKTVLIVTGKLTVNNINLHNKAEVTVNGDAELSNIIKAKGSVNQGFVCINKDRITVKK